jgi:hypothetical protein
MRQPGSDYLLRLILRPGCKINRNASDFQSRRKGTWLLAIPIAQFIIV